MALERGVTQPHGRFGIDRAARQIFRHPFHEPERGVDAHQRLHAGAGAAAAVHVVLELVHHLLLEDVLELGVRPGEGQHCAMLEELRDAAQAFTRGVDHVGLLEIGLRRVENDRLPALELMMQNARQPGVGALGHARGIQGADTLVGIVVDVEVLGLNRLETEVAVLNLVLTEVLSGQGRGGCSNQERRKHRQPTYGAFSHTAILSRLCYLHRPRQPRARRPTVARAGKNPEVPDETRGPRNPRSPARPNVPGPVLPHDGARDRRARVPSRDVPPSPAHGRSTFQIRSRNSRWPRTSRAGPCDRPTRQQSVRAPGQRLRRLFRCSFRPSLL